MGGTLERPGYGLLSMAENDIRRNSNTRYLTSRLSGGTSATRSAATPCLFLPNSAQVQLPPSAFSSSADRYRRSILMDVSASANQGPTGLHPMRHEPGQWCGAARISVRHSLARPRLVTPIRRAIVRGMACVLCSVLSFNEGLDRDCAFSQYAGRTSTSSLSYAHQSHGVVAWKSTQRGGICSNNGRLYIHRARACSCDKSTQVVLLPPLNSCA